jgi:8-oxo-dGTP pyrophosphatase MutT (NUDIX family)
MSLRPAATTMIFRQSPNGPEVLLLQRSRQLGFFPSAWVFPGGRVDSTDADFPVLGSVEGVENRFGVAAVREAFEEAGLWLGEGTPSADLRDALNQRTGQLPLDGSLKADLTLIRQWSWWITPDTEPKRYDTRFFVCVVPYEPDVEIVPDASETVEAKWLTPAGAVRLHEADGLFMAPPTYLTLLDMQDFTSTHEVWEAAAEQEVLPIQPIHDKSVKPMQICLPTHPLHPNKEPNLGCVSVTLDGLHWVRQ